MKRKRDVEINVEVWGAHAPSRAGRKIRVVAARYDLETGKVDLLK